MAKLKDLLSAPAQNLVDHPTAFLANSVIEDGKWLRFKNGPRGDDPDGPLTYACGDDDGHERKDKVVWDVYLGGDAPCTKTIYVIKYKEKTLKSERRHIVQPADTPDIIA